MKYFTVALVISISIALVSGQYFGPNFDGFGSYNGIGVSAVSGDFGGSATAFAGGFQARDPRQNRGPVVFPPSPDDAPVESSGVIVGASGYGFVPPGSQGQRNFYGGSNRGLSRFNSRYFQNFNYV